MAISGNQHSQDYFSLSLLLICFLFFFKEKCRGENNTCGIPITEIPKDYILVYLLPVISFLIKFFLATTGSLQVPRLEIEPRPWQ